jgi:hypothetical protein
MCHCGDTTGTARTNHVVFDEDNPRMITQDIRSSCFLKSCLLLLHVSTVSVGWIKSSVVIQNKRYCLGREVWMTIRTRKRLKHLEWTGHYSYTISKYCRTFRLFTHPADWRWHHDELSKLPAGLLIRVRSDDRPSQWKASNMQLKKDSQQLILFWMHWISF